MGRKILIVENDAIVAADLVLRLSRMGHEVVAVADTTARAWDATEEFRPEMVLLNLDLPGARDAIPTADATGRCWQVPLILLTTLREKGVLNRARAAGSPQFVTKPIRTEELKAALEAASPGQAASRELLTERTLFARLLGSWSDSVIATDAAGAVRYLNPAAETLTGWTAAEAFGRAIEAIYAVTTLEGTPARPCQLRKALATGRCTEIETFRMTNSGGSEIWVEDSAAPIVEAEQIAGAVSIVRDIAARINKEREQAVEQIELQGRFFATTEALGATTEVLGETAEALGQTRADVRDLAASLMRAQEDERRRIARELHDDLAQRTALLGLELEKALSSLDPVPDQTAAALHGLREGLAELARATRDISHRLHPSVIADLGLATALRGLVNEQRKNDLDVYLTIQNVPTSLSLENATVLYRIVQEGLRNAAKHAPDSAVHVTLSAGARELELRIEDTGPGFLPSEVKAKGGLGLLSMQERARLAGGSLILHTQPGQGTVLQVRVPV